jgi:hypothetical protein
MKKWRYNRTATDRAVHRNNTEKVDGAHQRSYGIQSNRAEPEAKDTIPRICRNGAAETSQDNSSLFRTLPKVIASAFGHELIL